MLYRTLISSFFVAAAFAFSPSAPAEIAGIQGAVRGMDGRPLQGAEVRIERKDKNGAPVTIQTNAKGSYASSTLPPGTYKVSVVENGTVKSNVTIKTAGSTARVDFNLKPSAGKAVIHYVLVSSGTGSRIAPFWVETDANGTPIAGALNMETKSGELEREMYRRQTNNQGR
jgi:Carboxypeptidase regulatory-like domain